MSVPGSNNQAEHPGIRTRGFKKRGVTGLASKQDPTTARWLFDVE